MKKIISVNNLLYGAFYNAYKALDNESLDNEKYPKFTNKIGLAYIRLREMNINIMDYSHLTMIEDDEDDEV